MVTNHLLPLHSRKGRRHPEAGLQSFVRQLLDFNAAPGVMFLSIPNEGRRAPRTGAHLKRMGMKPGAADMLLVIQGDAHFLELKVGRNKQSPAQLAFEAECFFFGIPYAVCRTPEEAARQLYILGGALRENPLAKPVARKAA